MAVTAFAGLLVCGSLPGPAPGVRGDTKRFPAPGDLEPGGDIVIAGST